MNDILELPEVRARVSRLSVAEYHQLGEFNENGRRTELIRGIVIEKMGESPLHSRIRTRIERKILAVLPDGYFVWKEEPLTFLDSEPEPDVSVVLGSENDRGASHPKTAELVVEVAVSSARLDRQNAPLYAEAGVKEYWIVLARQRQVEVYRRPENGVYLEQRLYSESETLACESVPAIHLSVTEIFPG